MTFLRLEFFCFGEKMGVASTHLTESVGIGKTMAMMHRLGKGVCP